MMCDVKYHVHSCSTLFSKYFRCVYIIFSRGNTTPDLRSAVAWAPRIHWSLPAGKRSNQTHRLDCRYILAIFTYNGWFVWFSVMNCCFNHYLAIVRSQPSMAIYSQINRHKKGIISSCYFCGSGKNMKVFYWCGDADHASSVGSSLSPWFTRSLKSSGCTDVSIALLS